MNDVILAFECPYGFVNRQEECKYVSGPECKKCRDKAELISELMQQWNKAVEPIIQEARDAFQMTSRWYMCGECQTPIDPGDRYCRHCGRMVRWE